MKWGLSCVGFGSNKAAGQFTRLMGRKHGVRTLLTIYAILLSVKTLSLRHDHADFLYGEILEAVHQTQFRVMQTTILEILPKKVSKIEQDASYRHILGAGAGVLVRPMIHCSLRTCYGHQMAIWSSNPPVVILKGQ
jgi:hypothetical protein